MRQFIKKQILSILDSMYELHQIMVNSENEEHRLIFISDCKEAGTIIKEVIEENATVQEDIQHLYSTYLHVLEQLEREQKKGEGILIEINKYPDTLKEIVNKIPLTYHVVFLPYKASMWDSLESIWKATLEDEHCISHVIPIPFFEFNSKTNEWEGRYEGEVFPKEVPITHFQEYSIEAMQPDIVYIHNPYDNGNRVTSIHPDYYSENLKKNVGKLIYVPYYVTSGFFTQEHLELSAYDHVDHIVVQSEHVRSKFANMPYYHKVISLGSPKLDHIINTCKKERQIPIEWQEHLNGKKVVMLNTSISAFLTDGEIYINKLFAMFKSIQGNKKIGFIWRPHPLIEGTLKSMRPHLLEQYKKLLVFYKKNNIGIFDSTPNLSNTIAISDAYVGDYSTSVYNLFEVVGKPIFILNNLIDKAFDENEKRRMWIYDGRVINNNIFFIGNIGGLFSINTNSLEIKQVGIFKNQPKWFESYLYMTNDEKNLYLSPFYASNPAEYSTESQKMLENKFEDANESQFCRYIIKYQQSIFYLPANDFFILEYNKENKLWKKHRKCIENVPKNQTNPLNVVGNYAVKENILWMIMENSHCVIEFDMDTAEYKYHALGEPNYGYSSISVDGDYLWLSEATSGYIIKWNYKTLEIKLYKLPKEIKHWSNTLGQRLVYKQFIDMGNYIVGVPGFSKYAIKIDKRTGEIKPLIPEFWNDNPEVANGYNASRIYSSMMAIKISDKTLWIQRTSDKAIAIVDIEKEVYEMFYPMLSENEFEKIMDNEDGFEQCDPYHIFSRKESQFFSFEDFLDDLANNRLAEVKKRQMNAIQTMADNLDGTSGEKIYNHFVEDILHDNV